MRLVKSQLIVFLWLYTDEEIGGGPGMAKFVKTDDFKNLNVGFSLDEGYASATEDYLVFNGERSIWRKLSINKCT